MIDAATTRIFEVALDRAGRWADEKLLPAGPLVGRVLGAGLIAWGAAGLFAALGGAS